jgi:catechol 2,3-dioxygenase-like lactoylglutathione lyase family enzyme
MAVLLDHVLVPSKDKNRAAKLLAEILGVRWEPCGEEPAAPSARPRVPAVSDFDWRQYRAQRASVYVNDSLTIDFVDARMLRADQPIPINHYCFRVSDADFDAVVERIKKAGLKFSSTGVGEPDDKINTRLGGKGFYFTEPDGHSWEILTVSYARPAK